VFEPQRKEAHNCLPAYTHMILETDSTALTSAQLCPKMNVATRLKITMLLGTLLT
jgi:hypothetical protein